MEAPAAQPEKEDVKQTETNKDTVEAQKSVPSSTSESTSDKMKEVTEEMGQLTVSAKPK